MNEQGSTARTSVEDAREVAIRVMRDDREVSQHEAEDALNAYEAAIKAESESVRELHEAANEYRKAKQFLDESRPISDPEGYDFARSRVYRAEAALQRAALKAVDESPRKEAK